jgi:predicted acetyltransferase
MRNQPTGGSLFRPAVEHVSSFRDLLHDEALRGQAKEWDLPFDTPELILHKHIASLDHTHYWWIDAGVVVGRIRLRDIAESDFYQTHGDVGYEVRPTHQGRGYATQMLKELLAKAREVERTHLLITCRTSNEPSRKVIEKCGGVLRDLYQDAFLRFDFELDSK